MEGIELVQASGLKPFILAMKRQGIDADRYLQQHGIPSEFIDLAYAPLPKRRRLWTFLDDVLESEGLVKFGDIMAEDMGLTDMGPLGIQLAHAPTFVEAFHLLRDNIVNYAQNNEVLVEHDGDKIWLVVESYKKTSRAADLLTVRFIVEMIRLAAGPDWLPRQARLQTPHAPEIEKFPLLKDCSVEFNRPGAAVTVSKDIVRSRLRKLDPSTPAAQAELNLTPLPDTGRISDSLRVVIAGYLPYEGPPSAEEAADMAGLSRSSLFRRLAAEGTSYRQLVEDVRYKAARKLLTNRRMNIKDVAYLLGYSVPNNFVRAFRKVAGVTPNEFRQSQAQAQA